MAGKGRAQRPTIEDVRAYLLIHPDAMGAHVQQAFPALLLSEARAMVSKIKRERSQDPKAPETIREPETIPKIEPSNRPPSSGATPADRLTDDDRATLGKAVRNLHKAILLHSERILREAENGAKEGAEDTALNKDDAQTLAHYQKIAAGLVDTYPGLLSMSESSEAGKPTGKANDQDRALVGQLLKRKAEKES